MTVIKTAEWLRDKLKENNMTQKELALKTGISVNAISKIVRKERFGSEESWKKINSVFDPDGIEMSQVTFTSRSRLTADIKHYGEDHECKVYCTSNNSYVMFVDYTLPEHNRQSRCVYSFSINVTLKEAYMLFTHQNVN